MNLAYQYAKALHELIGEDGTEGKTYLENLKAALEKRGHEKLLPQILTEFENLEIAANRVAAAKAQTKEKEQTRVLFELYKKLTS
jgi:F0F1-type ATP synthase delta subunit